MHPKRVAILSAVVLTWSAPQALEAQRRPAGRTAPAVDVRTYTAPWDAVVKEAHARGYCFSIEDESYTMKTVAMASGPSPSVTLMEVYLQDTSAPMVEGLKLEKAVRGPDGEIRDGLQVVYSGDGLRTYRLLGPAMACSGPWEPIAPGQVLCNGGNVTGSARLLRDGWTIEAMRVSTPSGFTVERLPQQGDRDPTLRLTRRVPVNTNQPPVAGTISGTVEFRGPRGARWQDAFANLGQCRF